MKARVLLSLTTFVFLLIFSLSAQAAAFPEGKFASLRMVVGGVDTVTTQDPPPLLMGLEVKLAKGWKVYWRSPGDAGQALVLDWKNSSNISDVKILWPAPQRFVEEWGLEVYGYKNDLVLPLVVNRNDSGQVSHLALDVSYAVCSDICVPYEEHFELDLPQNVMGSPQDMALVEQAISRVPKPNGAHGIQITQVMREEELNNKGVLRVTAESMTSRFVQPDVFVEGETGFRFPKPAFRLKDSSRQVEFRIPYEITLPGLSLAEKNVSLTLVDGPRSVETSMTVPAAFDKTVSEENTASPSLITILLSALIGGLILNVMPCVLPVLSLKLVGLLKQHNVTNRQLRKSFLLTAAGIITSFLILAMIVIMAKQAGEVIGWGFHFQEPIFLIALALVMFWFAAATWDLFQINLPGFLSGQVSRNSMRSNASGDFLSGMFATLLATPCSAPFLGTAIGFALARGAGEIFLIFTVLGIGLALPYFLGMLFPKLLHLLPKPGKWMLHVKFIMGVLLAVTAIWLIWIVSQQVGVVMGICVLALSIFMLLLLWLANKGRFAKLRRPLWLVALLLGAVALGLPFINHLLPASPSVTQTAESEKAGIAWQEFAPDTIPQLVSAGQTVLVDVTADWCLTCKANELLVLSKPEIVTAVSAEHIVAMRADWTKRDPHINQYLASFGRYGIPFNIVYGPNLPQGKTLSELLTQDELLSALKEAGKAEEKY